MMFVGYENCGRYYRNPFASPCEDSIAYNLFPNAVAYVTVHGAATLTIGANALFVAALWLIPWFRKHSWKRTVLATVGYLIVSAAFSFAVIFLLLSGQLAMGRLAMGRL